MCRIRLFLKKLGRKFVPGWEGRCVRLMVLLGVLVGSEALLLERASAQASESFSEKGRCEEVIPMSEGTDVHQRGKLLLLTAVAMAVVLGLTRNSWRR